MANHEQQWSSATPGLLIVLLDQSGSMKESYEGSDSKAVFSSKAVNRVIDTIIQKSYDGISPKNRCFISVIGYESNVSELTSGFLSDFDSKPLRIDSIKKKVSDGAGGLVEIDYKMPIWIEPKTAGATNMKGAFETAKEVVEKWIQSKPGNPAPVIINISDGVPYFDGKEVIDCMKETTTVAQSIMNLYTNDGEVLIFNALIGASGPKTVLPSSESELNSDEEKFLFNISSTIPEAYKPAAQKNELPVKDGSKGFIFNADAELLVKLIDFGSSKGQGDK
jgi:hypothetical protein